MERGEQKVESAAYSGVVSMRLSVKRMTIKATTMTHRIKRMALRSDLRI